MQDSVFEELPWLRPYKPRPYFGGAKGNPRPKKEPSVRRRKETWLYTVVLEQMPQGGGKLKLFSYARTSPVATAPFTDRSEGDRMFEELWEKVQRMTQEANETLS